MPAVCSCCGTARCLSPTFFAAIPAEECTPFDCPKIDGLHGHGQTTTTSPPPARSGPSKTDQHHTSPPMSLATLQLKPISQPPTSTGATHLPRYHPHSTVPPTRFEQRAEFSVSSGQAGRSTPGAGGSPAGATHLPRKLSSRPCCCFAPIPYDRQQIYQRQRNRLRGIV